MAWLSAEEKTSSMMPYLLDLPPLDRPQESNVQVIETNDDKVINKTSSKPKKSENIETEK